MTDDELKRYLQNSKTPQPPEKLEASLFRAISQLSEEPIPSERIQPTFDRVWTYTMATSIALAIAIGYALGNQAGRQIALQAISVVNTGGGS